MYSFVAVSGQIQAGFAGFPHSTSGATGPSTVVECGPHAEMASMSRRMASALGATGFLSFDFMIERATGNAFLLECNPRPNQVSHLGVRIGADLCSALMSGLRNGSACIGGRGSLDANTKSSELVTLFPQEWLHDPASPALQGYYHDVPWDDPSLIARFVRGGPGNACQNHCVERKRIWFQFLQGC